MNLVYMLSFVVPACNRTCIRLDVKARFHKPLELASGNTKHYIQE